MNPIYQQWFAGKNLDSEVSKVSLIFFLNFDQISVLTSKKQDEIALYVCIVLYSTVIDTFYLIRGFYFETDLMLHDVIQMNLKLIEVTKSAR